MPETNFKPRVAILQSNSSDAPQNCFVMGFIDINVDSIVHQPEDLRPITDGEYSIEYNVNNPNSGHVITHPLQSHIKGFTMNEMKFIENVVAIVDGEVNTSGDIKHIPPHPDDQYKWIQEELVDHPLYECRPFVLQSDSPGLSNNYFVCGLVDIPADSILETVETQGPNIVINLTYPDPHSGNSNPHTYFIRLQPSAVDEFQFMYINGTVPPVTPNISYANAVKV